MYHRTLPKFFEINNCVVHVFFYSTHYQLDRISVRRKSRDGKLQRVKARGTWTIYLSIPTELYEVAPHHHTSISASTTQVLEKEKAY